MGTTMVPATEADRPAVSPQTMSALAKANRIRVARAKLMQRMEVLPSRESCSMAADLVADPPDVMLSMEVFDLLHRVKRVGPGVADGLLRAAGITANVQLGVLTSRKRAALEAALRYRSEFCAKVAA